MNALFLTAWIACQSFDVASTAIALNNPRLKEGNPLMRGPQLYTLKVSANIGAFFWQRDIARARPTSKVRHVVPLTMAAAGCAAGTLNTRTIQSVR